ncbi:protein phosphatase 1 regulatory subunit 21 [Bacillus rossius redtenbacheri]|uniref:protein phosphatase 1 regulatory subunit 21 n=1 Tax=Bacillus rossius redtenbacheri TaxID=93214 RepID=UPI002FDE8744
METVSDLHAKYQKLATEYSKMRAQTGVLKAAVLEERGLVAELREQARQKEQRVRKAQQEMDGLTFRNQQLAKRVAVLQDELDVAQSRTRKGRGKGSGDPGYTAESSNHVLDEEFHNKIEENARLLSLLQEKEDAHQQEVCALTDRLRHLEQELQDRHQVTSESEENFKVAVNRLEQEKAELQEAAAARDSANDQLVSLQHQYYQLQRELGSQLQATNSIVRYHLPFVDTKKEDLNELNVPRYDRRQQLYAVHVLTQAGNHVKEVASALSDYHTYTEQRLHTLSDRLSHANCRFSAHLKENARYLRALEQGYVEFQRGIEYGESLVSLECLSSLQCLSSPLAAYTSYFTKLASSHVLSLEEESAAMSATEKLCAANKEVLGHFTAVGAQISKLNMYVKLLASQSRRSGQNPPSSQARLLSELTTVVAALHDAFRDMQRSWTRKTEVESQLPTTSEKMRTTNTCLTNALAAVVASLGKLSGLLRDSRSELCRSSVPSSQTHPVVARYKRRAVAYMNCLEQEEPPSVPYDDALREREQMRSTVSSMRALQSQLLDAQQRVARLDQEKEHWKLEFQLLELRHSKKVRELEEGLAAATGQAGEPPRPRSETETTPPVNLTSLLGRLDSPLPVLGAEVEAREEEVKRYFKGKINELVEKVQDMETKASMYSYECDSMRERLELCVAGKQSSDASLGQVQEGAARLQEELATTTESYELQLRIMSEHLAGMNDKLTAQQDEIDQLKYQLTAKPGWKGKQK